jgi:hypothetical protein
LPGGWRGDSKGAVPPPDTTTSNRSIPTLVTELWDLVRDYAKQELISPVKGLGRWVGLGIAGSFCLGLGGVLVVLAALRALQTESGDAFDGNLTFVPYLIVLIGCGALAGLAASRIGKRRDR